MGPPSGWGRRLGKERDRSLLEGSCPQKGGAWPRAPPSHLALQLALSTLTPTCCQTQDAPRDVLLSLHGSRDTDTWGRAHKVPGYTGRHGYPVHAHHQPSTSLLTPPLCEEACTGADTEAQVWTQALRGQHMGAKTHTCRDHRLFGRWGGVSQVLSHTQLLKLRSTPTGAPPRTHPCALTHRETPGSRHPHILQSV